MYQMSQAFLDEYGLLPPLLEITHVNQTVDVLLMGLACILNILSEEYKINKLVEAGLIGVARPLSGHEDERVQQHAAGIFLAISSCSGLEEWLVSVMQCQIIKRWEKNSFKRTSEGPRQALLLHSGL